jgi:galactose mutarotase-like enzyme
MSDPVVSIRSDQLSAAELQTLRDRDGRDLLWSGDPAVWAGRAPVLFPIVGELAGGRYRIGSKSYSLGRHGFARRSRFEVVDHTDEMAVFRLEADDASRLVYPFEFRLELRFAITGAAIEMAATVTNQGDVPMPASFGFHPALRWPLPYGGSRESHRLLFDEPEPAQTRRLDTDGLLDPLPRSTPIAGRELVLNDRLFADDALILDEPASRGLLYGAPGEPQIRVDFSDMPMLGLWSKPGAGYVCIEPWHGVADPAGFADDIFAKPGIVTIAPEANRQFVTRLSIIQLDANRAQA